MRPDSTSIVYDGPDAIRDPEEGYFGTVFAEEHEGTVFLTVRDLMELGGPGRRVDVRLSPDEAHDLGARLTDAARHAFGHRLRSVARGECSKCGNLRLVSETRPGHPRPELVHCPECSWRLPADVPTVAGWPKGEIR